MNKCFPTRAQKIALLKDIRYEIESLIGTPRHDPADEATVETVYFRKIAHARALHTFFTTAAPDRLKNDAISEDYSFPASPIFPASRSKELLERFNQALFHISYSRAFTTPGDQAWPLEEFVPPIVDRSTAFVHHFLSLKWQDVSQEEKMLWWRMLTPAYVRIPLAQSTSNIAASQITAVESHIRGVKQPGSRLQDLTFEVCHRCFLPMAESYSR